MLWKVVGIGLGIGIGAFNFKVIVIGTGIGHQNGIGASLQIRNQSLVKN